MRKKLLNLCMTMLLSVVSTAAWALSEMGGIYQIGTAEDFAAFAELVNGGERNANAVLTADIDLGSTNTKIGVGGDYQGVFNGAGHTITIAFVDTETQGPALFRGIGNHGVIENLKVQGSITTAKPHAAGISNYCSGIIRNCYTDVNIECDNLADASAAGIVGQLNKMSTVENCLAKVVITGANSHKCGGVAAWADSKFVNIANCLVINDDCGFDWSDGSSAGLVRNDGNLAIVDLDTYNADSYHNRPTGACANNYVTNDWGTTNKGTTVVSSEDLASGKICYQLNSDQSKIRCRWVHRPGSA